MSKKGQRKVGQCVYCGAITEISRDHVINKGLFVPLYPPNLITVPCCDMCNQAKSVGDVYLRDLLATDIVGNTSPTAYELFTTKVLKSHLRNSSVVARTALLQAKEESFYTKGGVYLGEVITSPLDEAKFESLFKMIIRGLYYDARKERIPDDYQFEIYRFFPWEVNALWEKFQEMHMNGPRILGNVFGCAFLSAQEDRFTTLWLLWFYERVFFSVYVKNQVNLASQPAA